MPRSLPRKGAFYGTNQFIRGISDYVAIDAKRDLYIAVPGKILYLLDVHAGLAKTCDLSMAKQVRSHLEVQRLLDLWAALFGLFLRGGR